MTEHLQSVPSIEKAFARAMRKRVLSAIGVDGQHQPLDQYATLVAELLTWDSLEGRNSLEEEQRNLAKTAFALLRESGSEGPTRRDRIVWLLRTSCLSVLADLPQEGRKLMSAEDITETGTPDNWLDFCRETVWTSWLGLLRHRTNDDVELAQSVLKKLRSLQKKHEEPFLSGLQNSSERKTTALELMALYFLGTAAERLSEYLLTGTADGAGDIDAQLDMYFDRTLHVLDRGFSIQDIDVALLLQPTAHCLANGSIQAATRGASSLTRRFAETLIGRKHQPLFQLLPPQRAALREQNLISSAHRSVVVNFPTSSGKTLLAAFNVLQALSDLGTERGWVAYVAPTRALVNQVTNRLRRDFAPLDKRVERLSPALEFDSVELSTLAPSDVEVDGPPVDVLVCTPEKLDLLVRREELCSQLGRLALVVVDEAHGIGAKGGRAIKLELLLSMINREHPNTRFLLLTPFIRNAKRVAQWLDQTNCKDYSIDAEWVPNDRIIGISSPPPRVGRDGTQEADRIRFRPIATPKRSLHLDEELELGGISPDLGFTLSDIRSNAGKLATATAQVLSTRGPTVILCYTVKQTWSSASDLAKVKREHLPGDDERKAVANFVRHELGKSNPLGDLIESGIAVHHGGLPDEVAQAIEWLFENRRLYALCATTTLAQGVNFPIANLVLSSIYLPTRDGEPISFSDFWNIAGRVGRVDQDAIGVVALAAKDDKTKEKCEEFLERKMIDLASTLESMVSELGKLGAERELSALVYKKEWSNFSQFIAHTLRHVGIAKFTDQVELVLRGTLGYQRLRETASPRARELLTMTSQYAAKLANDMGAVKLVDSTGFSFESVRGALGRLSELESLGDMLDPSALFSGRSDTLRDVMGVLLTIPEVRDDLIEGGGKGGGRIAEMLSAWVHGAELEVLAAQYFPSQSPDEDNITTCVKKFRKLSMTSAWGLASVLAMKFGREIEEMSDDEKKIVTNIPSMVLYGVWNQKQIALRSSGVPRNAAMKLAEQMEGASTPYATRRYLNQGGQDLWMKALGKERGRDYFKVWSMLDGA